MNRLTSLALTASTMLAVAACGGDAETPDTDDSPADARYQNVEGTVTETEVPALEHSFTDPQEVIDALAPSTLQRSCEAEEQLDDTDINGALYVSCEDFSVRIYNGVEHADESIPGYFETNPAAGLVAHKSESMVLYGDLTVVEEVVERLREAGA